MRLAQGDRAFDTGSSCSAPTARRTNLPNTGGSAMIPTTTINERIEFEVPPSKTYALEDGRVIDGLEALEQSIFCILQTERFEWPIYSWNYGMETLDLYGKDPDWVRLEVERRITEALMQDDRISDVSEFAFIQDKKKLSVAFLVTTVFGETEVMYDFV